MHAAAISFGKASSLFRRAHGVLVSTFLLTSFVALALHAQTGSVFAGTIERAKSRTEFANERPECQRRATETRARHDHRHRPRRSGRQLSARIRHRRHARRRAAQETRRSRRPSSRATCSTTRFRACSPTWFKNDASVGDDYVPVGYYGDYQIRGFPLDLATGLEINGMTIAGEQDVPLENKEARRISQRHCRRGERRGLGRRPDRLRHQAPGHHPGASILPPIIAAPRMARSDLGHLFGSRKQVGARVNLAGERIVSYMNDTNGWRAVGAGAADWKLNPPGHSQGRLRIPAQNRARRQRLSVARRHYAARHQPHLPFDNARRSALGPARHLRHLQHRRAARPHLLALVGRLRGRRPQPLAHPGQRDLRVRLLLRGRVQHRLGAVSILLCARRNLRHLRLPRPRRTAHRRRSRSDGHGPHPHRRRHARPDGGRRTFSAQRAAARLLHCGKSLFARWQSCRTARSTPMSAPTTSTSRSPLLRPQAIRIRLSRRCNPPARADFGKTVTSPPA